ncbi:MAG: hypothetical protein JO053_07985 [Acidobacteria bacterium]|nr:hypothetical protein [Acidobacteriota bacterium]
MLQETFLYRDPRQRSAVVSVLLLCVIWTTSCRSGVRQSEQAQHSHRSDQSLIESFQTNGKDFEQVLKWLKEDKAYQPIGDHKEGEPLLESKWITLDSPKTAEDEKYMAVFRRLGIATAFAARKDGKIDNVELTASRSEFSYRMKEEDILDRIFGTDRHKTSSTKGYYWRECIPCSDDEVPKNRRISSSDGGVTITYCKPCGTPKNPDYLEWIETAPDLDRYNGATYLPGIYRSLGNNWYLYIDTTNDEPRGE